MTKAKIILISILIFIIALASVLFGAVFRVRKQSLVAVGEDVQYCEELKTEILSSSGIKNGQSIFMINKDLAISNIEKAYPYIKVIQVRTTSFIEIEFHVRKRFETYYSEVNSKYYILDEELKVLKIQSVGEVEKPNLSEFDSSKLGIDSNTKVGDIVSTKYYQQIANDLYGALYSNALLDRDKISSKITSISFDEGFTLYGSYTRLILQTTTGVKMDICKPETNLNNKINICFSTYNSENLTTEQKASGVIKIYLDENNIQHVGYFE